MLQMSGCSGDADSPPVISIACSASMLMRCPFPIRGFLARPAPVALSFPVAAPRRQWAASPLWCDVYQIQAEHLRKGAPRTL